MELRQVHLVIFSVSSIKIFDILRKIVLLQEIVVLPCQFFFQFQKIGLRNQINNHDDNQQIIKYNCLSCSQNYKILPVLRAGDDTKMDEFWENFQGGGSKAV